MEGGGSRLTNCSTVSIENNSRTPVDLSHTYIAAKVFGFKQDFSGILLGRAFL